MVIVGMAVSLGNTPHGQCIQLGELDQRTASGKTDSTLADEKPREPQIELDPKYIDMIVRRWQEWTGKQATRAADGALFDNWAQGVRNR